MLPNMQVDAWGAFIPDKANQVEKIKEEIVKEVESRGIENLEISTEMLGVGTATQALMGEKREHIIFQQKLGGGANASVALRVAKRGTKDLELSWRLFEGNPLKSVAKGATQWGLVIFGGIFTLVSIFLIPAGVGICSTPIGLFILAYGLGWRYRSKGKSEATTYQQLDSRALVQAVDFSLMKVLEDIGVSKDELRILVASQTEGIGKLGT